jgi:ArsR family transcriptional regulator, nickel/cobalt-responsive transcriptional repressor
VRDSLQSKKCAEYLKALAAPERLRIIQCLRSGPMNVTAIADELHRPLVNVSHHLGILRRAGLVRARRQGKLISYSLSPRYFRSTDGPPHCLDLGCCRLDLGGDN